MSLKVVCAGYIVRHPVGGLCWHHLQYLVGLRRMGHAVTFLESHGWPDSCFDPARNAMTDDPSYGLRFVQSLFAPHGLENDWCYLAADGSAHGMSRDELAQRCRECDLLLNLSNVNWTPELLGCRKRALVDTDPVFTQIGGFGVENALDRHDLLFTYGESVHRAGCEMPTAGKSWLPTRQPMVLDLWPVAPTAVGEDAAWTTVMNWSAYGGRDRVHEGRTYGQKAREFEPFYSFPKAVEQPMELAVTPPEDVRQRLIEGGWRIADPLAITRTPERYQRYLRESRGEFSVAKHGYVVARCGWFSDRTAGYLASGRPAIVQDTGAAEFLPTGQGLMMWQTPADAARAIHSVNENYASHCRAARALAEEYFDSHRVLSHLLERCI